MTVAVAVARGQRALLPMAGDGREGRGQRALGLPGDGQCGWHKFAGPAGTCTGRAPGCAGLRWAGRWLLFPGRGGSAARLRLHWGPAAPRGALTSAPGALCARSEGPTGGSERARTAGQTRGSFGDPRQIAEGEETPRSQRRMGTEGSGILGPRPRPR